MNAGSKHDAFLALMDTKVVFNLVLYVISVNALIRFFKIEIQKRPILENNNCIKEACNINIKSSSMETITSESL